MASNLRLLCVVAHPDDESLGFGGILARYAAEGVETALLTATRGEYGWTGAPDQSPGPQALGRLREQELLAAARELQINHLRILDYCDGALDSADADEAIGLIADVICQIRPHVIVTFGPEGATGHTDHIAISQFTSAAVVRAAADRLVAHQVSKLYYLAESQAQVAIYERMFGPLAMQVDGVERRVYGLPDWQVTTRIDTADHWARVWAAISRHRSQLPNIAELAALSEAQQRALWGRQELYRVFSMVNGGRAVEDDLFAGLRRSVALEVR